MIWDAVEEQPFELVTVTVYVPGVLTGKLAFVPIVAEPFDHEYVPPPVAVKVIDCVAHVRIVEFGAFIPAFGMALF